MESVKNMKKNNKRKYCRKCKGRGGSVVRGASSTGEITDKAKTGVLAYWWEVCDCAKKKNE